ncbi:MAG: hypothetical protein WBQ14_00515 [Gaiellaceae bacterium]
MQLEKQLKSGDIHLATFSDEDIAAVTPLIPREERSVPLSSLDELGEDELENALAAARQSLRDHGFLVEGEPDKALGELAAILEFRSDPSLLVIVEHLSRDEEDHALYLYGVGSVGYLSEVAQEGTHTFTFCSRSSTADKLADLVYSSSQSDTSDGPPLEKLNETASPGWGEFERALDAVQVITRLSSSIRIAPDTFEVNALAFAACENGVWGFAGENDEKSSAIYARALSRGSVRAAIGEFLGEDEITAPSDPE